VSASFEIEKLLRANLPPAATPWAGFPEFNFVGGHNDAASVPVEGLIAATANVLRREGSDLAFYGMQSGPLGYRPLREYLARKLARDSGIQCSSDEILITAGSLHGLDFVNAVLLEPGDTVIVEQMTYGGAITRLKRLGVNVVGVPVDNDGLSADALRTRLSELRQRGVLPKYIYTIPTVQNPTATVMSLGRRRALLALSEEFGVPIFEDECYADLTWSGTRPLALRSMVKDDRVIHIGSFSKTIAPALRLGYIVASWPLMRRILSIKNDGGCGALEQMMLAEYCPAHFDDHVVELRKTLRGKLDAMIDALRKEFGDEVSFDYPAGGIFLWMSLPSPVDTSRLYQAGLQSGIAINPGAEWMTDTSAGQSRLRLCFAQPSHQIIYDGVARLAQVCQREFGVPKRAASAHR
jgi:2-aminoadipate transaminase